jgi:hypothetical protein
MIPHDRIIINPITTGAGDKSVCDWSYVGTHQWRRYPSDNELKMWAYAVGLTRILWKRKRGREGIRYFYHSL